MQLISVLLYVVLTLVFKESHGGIVKPKLDMINFDLKDGENYETESQEKDAPQILLKEHNQADEPTIFRLKRSDNVIEEENLGTTMSWYKVTWRYSRLDDNDSKFRNINS